MHLINKDHYGSWAASQLPITTTALIQPSNQSTCLYRIFLATSFCPGISRPGPTHQLSLMAGPTGLFNFTSFACATQLRITVPIPFTTLSNYIEHPFLPFLYFVHHYLGGILFHGLSGNCINRQALSRRLTQHTPHWLTISGLCARVWLFIFTMHTLVGNIDYHLGWVGYLTPNSSGANGIMSTDHSVSTEMERYTTFLLIWQYTHTQTQTNLKLPLKQLEFNSDIGDMKWPLRVFPSANFLPQELLGGRTTFESATQKQRWLLRYSNYIDPCSFNASWSSSLLRLLPCIVRWWCIFVIAIANNRQALGGE
jgi:hypothetical protein